MRRKITRYIYEVIIESDDDELEFTDASSPTFLVEQDEDDEDDMDEYSSAPDMPDVVIGFRASEKKEPKC